MAGGASGAFGAGAGGGVVEGDAEGVRSPGRSPTRSLFSVHAARSDAPSVSTQIPLSNLFIVLLLSLGIDPEHLTVQWKCHGTLA